MSRMAVIYWSMTGNTEAMANAIAEGAAGAGAEVDVKQVCDTNVYQDEGLILHLTPDEEGLEQCRTFGAGFAKY